MPVVYDEELPDANSVRKYHDKRTGGLVEVRECREAKTVNSRWVSVLRSGVLILQKKRGKPKIEAQNRK